MDSCPCTLCADSCPCTLCADSCPCTFCRIPDPDDWIVDWLAAIIWPLFLTDRYDMTDWLTDLPLLIWLSWLTDITFMTDWPLWYDLYDWQIQLNFVKANFIKTNNSLRRSECSVSNRVLLILTKIQLFKLKYLCRTFMCRSIFCGPEVAFSSKKSTG